MTAAALRLPDDEVGEVRRRLHDPGALARALGLVVDQRISSGSIVIRCPVHDDSTPSCSVRYNGDDGTIQVRCFGCDFAGDALHLIAAARGLTLPNDFPAVMAEARHLAGMGPRGPFVPSSRPRLVSAPAAPAAPPPRPAPTADERELGAALDELLGACPLVDLDGAGGDLAASLAFRGLLDEARADGWGALPHPGVSRVRDLDEGAGFPFRDDGGNAAVLGALAGSGALARLDWLMAPHGWKHGDHRLLIPWRGPAGRVWTLQRRWCRHDGDTAASPGERKYRFPERKDVPAPAGAYPYGWERAEDGAAEELWLCEGAVDSLALRALNRRGALRTGGGERSMAVLGLAGLQSWSSVADVVTSLARGRRVFLALDADAPADKAAEQITPDLYRAGATQVRRLRPQQGKDWAEWLEAEVRRSWL